MKEQEVNVTCLVLSVQLAHPARITNRVYIVLDGKIFLPLYLDHRILVPCHVTITWVGGNPPCHMTHTRTRYRIAVWQG